MAAGSAHIEAMSATQPDMFAMLQPPAVDGLRTAPDMVSPEEEQRLIAGIDAAGLAPFAFQQWLGRRLTASFGSAYDFTAGRTMEAPPVPEWLLPLRARMAAWAGFAPADLAQVLLIRYDPGAGIGWHRDRPQYGTVLGLSLGNESALRLRRRRAHGRWDRHTEPLMPRGAYRLDGPARWEWEHSIAPVTQPRWSITFRTDRAV